MKNRMKCIGMMPVLAGMLVATTGMETVASTEASDAWEFGATLYGWFPNIDGTATAPSGGSDDISVDINEILENLEFTAMGVFELRKNRWGLVTDLIYMDVSDSKSVSEAGGYANVGLELTSWIWSLAASYRVVDEPALALDVIAGTRYLDIEEKVNWNQNIDPMLPPVGEVELDLANWDAIIGLRGRYAFGSEKSFFVPFEIDAGTGDSDFTAQAVAGLGYTFGAWDISAVWRYLYYDFASDEPIEDLSFNGPAVGLGYRW
ncbi:hypothetical protein P4E94_05705 [Pontiellaceae bacterium B12219]|nr:hypothetical protein [Pontiellaceae bacterium B12219]